MYCRPARAADRASGTAQYGAVQALTDCYTVALLKRNLYILSSWLSAMASCDELSSEVPADAAEEPYFEIVDEHMGTHFACLKCRKKVGVKDAQLGLMLCRDCEPTFSVAPYVLPC
jgi:hypothetical protein